jgi:adenylosuccinate synthase
MLDIDHGTYPYVTSSCTGLGGAIQGLSLNPTKITSVIGVMKAYSTRVGSGPFPTEQTNKIGDKLQSVGREFGVTTGRRRRCGWLDIVMCRYSNAINYYTALNLTKLDVLDDFDEIKVATAYQIDGKELDSFPADLETLGKVEVAYAILPGWKSSTMGVRKWEDLPLRAQNYVEFIEREIGVPIKWIGTGPKRDHMIERFQ